MLWESFVIQDAWLANERYLAFNECRDMNKHFKAQSVNENAFVSLLSARTLEILVEPI